MNTINISKDMETGIPEIDAQHRELVERINAIILMGAKAFSKEETQKTIDFLEEYVIKHFSDEEALQVKCGYPFIETHKKLHKQYLFQFELTKKEFEEKGFSNSFAMNLNDSVTAWIVRHIKTSDADFGKYYTENMK